MKRFLLILFTFIVVSCAKKEPSDQFVGEYSYKLSGTITLEQLAPATPPEDGSEFVPQIYQFDMIPESGQMRILKSNESSSKMLLTMNALAGAVAIGNADIKDDKFDINIDDKVLVLKEIDDILLKELHCSCKGTGQKIDNTIIIKLNASGNINILKNQYTIKESKLECVARLN